MVFNKTIQSVKNKIFHKERIFDDVFKEGWIHLHLLVTPSKNYFLIEYCLYDKENKEVLFENFQQARRFYDNWCKGKKEDSLFDDEDEEAD